MNPVLHERLIPAALGMLVAGVALAACSHRIDGGEENDTDSGDGDGDGDGEDCGGFAVVPVFERPALVLVLDESAGMVAHTWDHDGDADTEEVTRWSSLFGLVEALLEEHDENLDFGLALFPSIGAEATPVEAACDLAGEPEVAVGEQNGAAMQDGEAIHGAYGCSDDG